MKKSISKNYIYNLSYQLLILVTPFITTPYISRVLGPDGVGTYSYTTSIVAYFILLASLGIANYAQREIAYHQDDVHAQSRIFYEVMGIRAITVSISLLSYYLIISHCDVEDKVIYWVQAINILVVLFDISWFFQGLEEFGKIVLRNFVIRILSIAGIFLLIHDVSDLLLYIGLMAVMNFLGAVSIWLYLPKYLVRVARNEINPFRNFVVIVQMFLPQIAIQIYTVFDKTMIGILTGSAFENGYYEQAEKIVKMALMVVTSLGPVMLPRIAAAYAHNDTEAIYRYIMRSYRFVWMIGLPMMFAMIGLIDTAVPWFFGPGYEKVGLLVKVFSVLLLAIGISNVTGIQYLMAVNRQNALTVSVTAGALVNFALNLVLIPLFMSLGAAIASITAEICVTAVQFWFVRRVFDVSEILLLGRKYLLGGMGMLLVIMLLDNALQPEACILTTAVLGLSGVAVYSLFLLCTRDELFMWGIGKAREKILQRFG